MNTTQADLLRSAMEGVAYNIRWGMEFVEPCRAKGQAYDGYGPADRQSLEERHLVPDLCRRLQKPVLQMMNPQMACAQGAASIAMVMGIYKDFSEIDRMLKDPL